MKTFNELSAINVNDYIEEKEGHKYLSWAWAWDFFKKACPDANYEIVKNPNNGLPYFESYAGAMVYTKVTANGITHEMWLPVMDGKNKAMKSESYTYKVKDWKTKQIVEKTVESFTMFDVNKTVMRCLVKNLAMFGLALYIYNKEDLPTEEQVDLADQADTWCLAINTAKDIDELKVIYSNAHHQLSKDKSAISKIASAKDAKKTQLGA
jgi:hypothetical protein